jgi:hypothetical protein
MMNCISLYIKNTIRLTKLTSCLKYCLIHLNIFYILVIVCNWLVSNIFLCYGPKIFNKLRFIIVSSFTCFDDNSFKIKISGIYSFVKFLNNSIFLLSYIFYFFFKFNININLILKEVIQ